LLAFSSAFAVLGWNFIGQYLHPVAGQSGSLGFLLPGIMFEVMAAAALVGMIWDIKDDLRPGSRRSPLASVSGPPIIRAVIPAGISPAPQQFGYGGFLAAGSNGAVADAVPQPGMTPPLATLAAWLATSAVGAVIGLLVSSSLINALK
jgi:hypothetical protein